MHAQNETLDFTFCFQWRGSCDDSWKWGSPGLHTANQRHPGPRRHVLHQTGEVAAMQTGLRLQTDRSLRMDTKHLQPCHCKDLNLQVVRKAICIYVQVTFAKEPFNSQIEHEGTRMPTNEIIRRKLVVMRHDAFSLKSCFESHGFEIILQRP